MRKQCLIIACICFLIAMIFLALLVGSVMAQEPITVDMGKIAMIESSNNPNAYNKHSGAVGLYQITKICLDDYNLYNSPRIAYNDLYKHEINEKVAQWYMNKRIPQLLRHYGKPDTVENRIIAYNAGISYVGKSVPRETLMYIEKYYR